MTDNRTTELRELLDERGVNAANRRKTQRIKDLERQLAARDEMKQ